MDANNKHDNVNGPYAGLTVGDLYNYAFVIGVLGGGYEAKAPDLTAEQFNKAMKFYTARASMPKLGESAAVSIYLPKTSALCYDRVFGYPGLHIPKDISFGGKTEVEMSVFARNLFIKCHSQGKRPHPSMDELIKKKFLFEGLNLSPETKLFDADTHAIAIAYARECGISVVPVFHTKNEGAKMLHKPGDTSVLITALSDLAVVDEEKLVWEQVQEFRKDNDARSKFRRLMHWLDAEMINKPQTFVSDEISNRLEEYEWALKKHGIMTLLGTITDILDGKFLVGASAVGAFLTLLETPGLAALAATGLVLTKGVVRISEKLVELEDIRRGPNSEVAYIHEVSKLTEEV